jgi:hypothetical protein
MNLGHIPAAKSQQVIADRGRNRVWSEEGGAEGGIFNCLGMFEEDHNDIEEEEEEEENETTE